MTIAEQLQARGLSQTLEMLLTQKFGTVSAAVTARLHSANSDTLTRWLARILSAETAEAVVEL